MIFGNLDAFLADLTDEARDLIDRACESHLQVMAGQVPPDAPADTVNAIAAEITETRALQQRLRIVKSTG